MLLTFFLTKKQTPHAPVGKDSCTTAHAPIIPIGTSPPVVVAVDNIKFGVGIESQIPTIQRYIDSHQNYVVDPFAMHSNATIGILRTEQMQSWRCGGVVEKSFGKFSQILTLNCDRSNLWLFRDVQYADPHVRENLLTHPQNDEGSAFKQCQRIVNLAQRSRRSCRETTKHQWLRVRRHRPQVVYLTRRCPARRVQHGMCSNWRRNINNPDSVQEAELCILGCVHWVFLFLPRRRRPPHRRHHMLRITTTRVIIDWDRCSACWKAK